MLTIVVVIILWILASLSAWFSEEVELGLVNLAAKMRGAPREN